MPPDPGAKRHSGGFGAAVAAVNRQAARSLLRNHGGGHAAVSNLELFFDLVFVFAVTQLSHFLLEQLDLLRALQTLILFFAVWWAWMYTTWATNWIEPERAPNRLMLGAVMLGSLAMSAAIPEAYSDSGLAFAGAYIAVQIGRTLYVSVAMNEWKPETGNNMRRVACWFAVSAVLWIAGGWSEDVGTRMTLWIGALTIEYLGPVLFFWPVVDLGCDAGGLPEGSSSTTVLSVGSLEPVASSRSAWRSVFPSRNLIAMKGVPSSIPAAYTGQMPG